MDKQTLIKVANRDNGAVGYTLPELNNLRRMFQVGETKEITFEELEKLSYIPGGMEILRNSLVILDNDEAIRLLLGDVELEYSYSREDIINLMKNGSLDEFLDCLDFSPDGVKDLIKTLAVSLPLNDVSKREAIYEKLGFNVDNAIRIKNESQEPTTKNTATAKRRVQKTETKTASARRVVSSK